MSIQRSLRAQMLSLLGGSILLLIIVSLLCFHYLSRGITSYQTLLNGTLEASQLVDNANLEFKIQVQEWKNVLLRGKNPENLQKYWSQFESQEQKVKAQLNQLREQASAHQNAALVSQVQTLITEHQQLGQAYRAGRDQFLAANADPAVGDKAVKGIDRAASEQMSNLVKQLHQQGVQESELIANETSRTMTLGITILLGSALLITLLSL